MEQKALAECPAHPIMKVALLSFVQGNLSSSTLSLSLYNYQVYQLPLPINNKIKSLHAQTMCLETSL